MFLQIYSFSKGTPQLGDGVASKQLTVVTLCTDLFFLLRNLCFSLRKKNMIKKGKILHEQSLPFLTFSSWDWSFWACALQSDSDLDN